MYRKNFFIVSIIVLLSFNACSIKHSKALDTATNKHKISTIKIVTDSKRYRLGESADIDVSSVKEGYVNIFIVNPKSKIVKVDKGFIKKEFRSYTKPSMAGEYKLIAVLSLTKKDIKAHDFNIKNLEEKDSYDIYTFKVNK